MAPHNPNGFQLHPGPDRPAMGLSRAERHRLFREMVVGEMARGIMSRRRWRRLVQYAAMLDISAIEAGELIADAREAVARTEVPPFPHHPVRHHPTSREPWPFWVTLSVTCAILAVIDAVFFHWVF
ncbi:MAG: hypothetical protein JSV19_06775 [Phycisphaerales bacterium]|nr:MAG: hypothetical protein JSV19_06775 [Phycisphaerales bacterium]